MGVYLKACVFTKRKASFWRLRVKGLSLGEENVNGTHSLQCSIPYILQL